MKAKSAVWVLLLLLLSSAGCTKDPDEEEMRGEPSFYILTPLDFPPDYELDREEIMVNESEGIKGFYISMKFKRPREQEVLMTWTNIGYVFTDPEVQEQNFGALMALVLGDSNELDPPMVGDTNYFYSLDDPKRPGRKIYTFIYEKDNAQGFVTISTAGVSENEIRRILNIIKMKIA